MFPLWDCFVAIIWIELPYNFSGCVPLYAFFFPKSTRQKFIRKKGDFKVSNTDFILLCLYLFCRDCWYTSRWVIVVSSSSRGIFLVSCFQIQLKKNPYVWSETYMEQKCRSSHENTLSFILPSPLYSSTAAGRSMPLRGLKHVKTSMCDHETHFIFDISSVRKQTNKQTKDPLLTATCLDYFWETILVYFEVIQACLICKGGSGVKKVKTWSLLNSCYFAVWALYWSRAQVWYSSFWGFDLINFNLKIRNIKAETEKSAENT